MLVVLFTASCVALIAFVLLLCSVSDGDPTQLRSFNGVKIVSAGKGDVTGMILEEK